MNALYMQPENAGLLSFLEVSLHFLFVTLHGKGFYFAWTPLPLILQLLQQKDPSLYVGISYLDPEFVGDDRKIVTGVFIQTAYQRFKLQNFHDFITFDAKTSGVCTFGWKLMMPTVIDQEGKLRTGCILLGVCRRLW